jgi:hypothetical protein
LQRQGVSREAGLLKRKNPPDVLNLMAEQFVLQLLTNPGYCVPLPLTKKKPRTADLPFEANIGHAETVPMDSSYPSPFRFAMPLFASQ